MYSLCSLSCCINEINVFQLKYLETIIKLSIGVQHVQESGSVVLYSYTSKWRQQK
jgi:hypothetical protein